eukprot:6212972-Pleurochrysis_carterae.AAC.5
MPYALPAPLELAQLGAARRAGRSSSTARVSPHSIARSTARHRGATATCTQTYRQGSGVLLRLYCSY